MLLFCTIYYLLKLFLLKAFAGIYPHAKLIERVFFIAYKTLLNLCSYKKKFGCIRLTQRTLIITWFIENGCLVIESFWKCFFLNRMYLIFLCTASISLQSRLAMYLLHCFSRIEQRICLELGNYLEVKYNNVQITL